MLTVSPFEGGCTAPADCAPTLEVTDMANTAVVSTQFVLISSFSSSGLNAPAWRPDVETALNYSAEYFRDRST
jgi:hypothetical protein